MYNEFFGLKESPFSISPDPRYLFMSERHREALAHLLYGLGGGGGFVLLTGEIGAGKTTVCRAFLEQIPENCNVAYIFNPKLTVIELLRAICDEFHVKHTGRRGASATVSDYVEPLNDFLLQAHADGRNNVLIIDEAQNLAPDVIEQLRLLTNLETSERKLLQIVLIGQPELRALLARPDMEQLAQRVIARFHLPALSEQEAGHYVAHRLAVAGRMGPMPFDAKAVQRAHKLSRGIPRRINLLCDRALLGAYATGKSVVTREIVEKAAREVFDDEAPAATPRAASAADESASTAARGPAGLGPLARLHPFAWLALGLCGGLAVFGLGSLALRSGASGGAAAVSAASAPASAVIVRDASGAPMYTPPPAPAPTVGGAPATLGTPVSGVPVPAASPTVQRPAVAPVSAGLAEPPPAPGLLKAQHRSENDAWRDLAALWKLQLPAGDACTLASRQGVECHDGKGTLTTLQQLDRPAVLTLYDGGKKPVYALLNGLGPKTATLLVPGVSQTLPLDSLLKIWRGEFGTYWRTPVEWKGKVRLGASGPAVDWLGSRLALLQNTAQPPEGRKFDALLKSQVAAFQLSNGVKADGVAGPETFMALNRAIGVVEPRLIVEK